MIDPISSQKEAQHTSINPLEQPKTDLLVWELGHNPPKPILNSKLAESLNRENLTENEKQELHKSFFNSMTEILQTDPAYPEGSPFWKWLRETDYTTIVVFANTP